MTTKEKISRVAKGLIYLTLRLGRPLKEKVILKIKLFEAGTVECSKPTAVSLVRALRKKDQAIGEASRTPYPIPMRAFTVLETTTINK